MGKLSAKMVLALAFGTTGALAHDGVKDPHVKARMDAMRFISSQTKVLGTMAKGAADFDVERARDAATAIADQAAQLPDLFGVEATDPKSEARPRIWETYEDFVMMAGDLEMAASDAIEGVSKSSDLDAALRTIGTACKSCHQVYRD